jgi:sec-independent protein translocase protein TatA
MFGIGGGELIFVFLIILMFFGSDKIPEIARMLGKGMAQLKNATNDIKYEIQKGAGDVGFDPNSLTSGISEEIAKAKESWTDVVNDASLHNVQSDIEKAADLSVKKPDTPLEQLPDGPIKRQR